MQDTEATTTASRRVKSDGRRGQPEPGDVVVLGRVLLDVEVGLRDVRLGLVVVVVRDEVLDRVRREELAELVAELRGQRLVVRDHERGALDLLDDPGHRRGLAGAGRAEQGLELVARLDALGKLLDRLRLVSDRPVRVGCLEGRGHRDRLATGRRRNSRRSASASSPDSGAQTSHVYVLTVPSSPAVKTA